MKLVDGFKPLPWPQLREELLKLPPVEETFVFDSGTKVVGNDQFIKSHISIIDALPPPGPNISTSDKKKRLCAKPYYDRLLKYYYLRIHLIEA